MIDLRSDTVTMPSPGMRAAMASASVGDDQFGEDPTVNCLEARVAALLGKESAIFVSSGTMANQIALKVLTCPGDEVVVGGEAHILWHEAGAAAAFGGVQVVPVGTTGLFSADDLRRVHKRRGDRVFAPTGLVVVENTHNRGGGLVFPHAEAVRVCAVAGELGIPTYLDGARLFNAAQAQNLSIRILAEPFRLVSISLSKGLGCPVGSLLAGSAADVARARTLRRMFGGAMRQSGILAAAGVYALDHHLGDLATDHANARLFAAVMKGAPGLTSDLECIPTNIVMLRMPGGQGIAARVAAAAREQDVLLLPFGHDVIRVATHRDVTSADCQQAAVVIRQILEAGCVFGKPATASP